MEVVTQTILYTMGRGFVFNVLLPVWYIVIELFK